MSATFLISILIAALMVGAALRDLLVRRIPNGLSVGVALSGLTLRMLDGPMAALSSLAAAGLLFIVLFIAFARGVLGGGDVKLATAMALGLPPEGVWLMVVATALAGGVLSLVYLLLRWQARRHAPFPSGSRHLIGRFLAVEGRRLRRRGPLPYGVAIAAGSIFTLASLPAVG
ncbi:prepilin peptidase CpaA [Stella humosa]|uniref:Prepilin peptidase CpaA n=1 Tax=Stella humosa TaxID=94 RepID=A0A3N1MBP5_9PROT|nr:prepilin peptidase [Stella humosa]ROQ01153.1 prepilin peptidase CpaA [Stella humosa]BBK31528.1 prepilin peptidase [Stella humosa]